MYHPNKMEELGWFVGGFSAPQTIYYYNAYKTNEYEKI